MDTCPTGGSDSKKIFLSGSKISQVLVLRVGLFLRVLTRVHLNYPLFFFALRVISTRGNRVGLHV